MVLVSVSCWAAGYADPRTAEKTSRGWPRASEASSGEVTVNPVTLTSPMNGVAATEASAASVPGADSESPRGARCP